MKRILVTGGAGFIGSHLCARLIKEGCSVLCVDNFFTGKLANVAQLRTNPNFQLIEQDVTMQFSISGKLDEIYNLACPASPIHYQLDPIKTSKTSFLGALNILELATKKKAKVMQASTSEVYGNPLVHPQPESYWGNVNSVGSRSCYDEGKRCAEALFMDYYRQRGTKSKIVRIFNTYGPKMAIDDGRVVSNFVVQALRAEDITIYGEGKQTRSFQYIDDLIEGMLRVMDQDSCTGPINLGNPEEFTVLDLAQTILRITNSPSKLVYKPLPPDDPVQRKPDITLARTLLHWQPKTPLEEGLRRMIYYFRTVI